MAEKQLLCFTFWPRQEEQRAVFIKVTAGRAGSECEKDKRSSARSLFMSQVTPILSEGMGFLPQRWGLGAQEGSDVL